MSNRQQKNSTFGRALGGVDSLQNQLKLESLLSGVVTPVYIPPAIFPRDINRNLLPMSMYIGYTQEWGEWVTKYADILTGDTIAQSGFYLFTPTDLESGVWSEGVDTQQYVVSQL